MALLTTFNVSQSFGAADIFTGVNVSIPNDGKVGLVGPNGVGKTTLLLILAGLSKPASGSVHVARGATVGYLPQEASKAFAGLDQTVYEALLAVFDNVRQTEARLRQLEAQMANDGLTDDLFSQYGHLQEQFERAGGYQYEVRIKQVLTGLGFGEADWAMPVSQLSGGQKTRVLLARLLLEAPDLLVMDEPTNHLDVDAIEWLEGVLQTWDGAVLVVSHDRYFLDRVVDTIWEMAPMGIQMYRGNYSAYVRQREERWQQQEQTYNSLMARLQKEMEYIRRNIAGQRTQMAQGKLSRLAREVEAIHAGGLSVLGKLKSKGWAQVVDEVGLAERPAATVATLQQRINELQAPTRPLTLSMSFPRADRSGDLVLRTRDLSIGYPGTPLFTADDIVLHRGETAALLGPNGAGKSTFLRAILEEIPPLAGAIQLGANLTLGYFSQTHDELNPDNTVLDELLRHQPMLLSEARSYLARFLFRGEDVYKQVGSLSGGEHSRLALALLVLAGANFLLLDEPTNHLDIPAQEELQAALEQFNGTVLMVTHDRYLVDRLATQIWEVVLDDRENDAGDVEGNGRLRIYPIPYREYLEQRQTPSSETANETTTGETPSDPAPQPNGDQEALSKNERRRLRAQVAGLEDKITAAEAALETIGQRLQAATEAEAFDKIQGLSIEYAAVEERLEALIEAWEALARE